MMRNSPEQCQYHFQTGRLATNLSRLYPDGAVADFVPGHDGRFDRPVGTGKYVANDNADEKGPGHSIAALIPRISFRLPF